MILVTLSRRYVVVRAFFPPGQGKARHEIEMKKLITREQKHVFSQADSLAPSKFPPTIHGTNPIPNPVQLRSRHKIAR